MPASHARRAWLAALAVLTAGLAACSDSSSDGVGGVLGGGDEETAAPKARVETNLESRREVPVDHVVRLRAEGGRLSEARLVATKGEDEGPVPGSLRDGRVWRADDLLEPGTTYRLTALARNDDGARTTYSRSFTTEALSLDEQTYASIAPLEGQVVGVGMPVILRFDLPVENKAAFERRMSVKTAPAQPGTWHWISDTEAHWRPRTYWKPGTEVTVRADINSVDAGNGIYGQEDRVAKFRIGDAVVMKIHVPSYQMKVYRNGQLLRTIPISAGKEGFTTRSGVKVIVERFRYKDMTSASIGIADEASADFYDLENVEYAQRVTYSGEFLHAAPWSVGSQGSANVSHGCVGMSTENAGWLFAQTKVGDVVEVTGTDRFMELANGFGDWNLSWADYKEGSALS